MKVEEVKDDITKHEYLSTEKGKISLLYPCKFTMDQYEIYSLEGDLFEGIMRFDNYHDAYKMCEMYLK